MDRFLNKIILGDCLEVMKDIPDHTVDMILCDLPYGKLEHKWDSIIPVDKLWEIYERIIKIDGAIVLTSIQPFSSLLVASNLKMFKYSLVWDKGKPGNIWIAKLRPLQTHEDILVFSKGTVANKSNRLMKYFPIMEEIEKPQKYKMGKDSSSFSRKSHKSIEYIRTHSYPKSIIRIFNSNRNKIHPTQKPVPLFEYLIKTYTQEGEIILDNCIGSGTTAIACINTKRNYIGIEKDEHYFEVAQERTSKHNGIE